MYKRKHKERQYKNALASVVTLWKEALNVALTNPERARSYVKQIRAIKKHVKIKLPDEIRRGYCKKCNMPFIEGKTMSKSTKGKFIILKCLNCGGIRKYGVDKLDK